MFTATLFIITKTWKEPKYPSTDDGFKKIQWFKKSQKRMKYCHLQHHGWS